MVINAIKQLLQKNMILNLNKGLINIIYYISIKHKHVNMVILFGVIIPLNIGFRKMTMVLLNYHSV